MTPYIYDIKSFNWDKDENTFFALGSQLFTHNPNGSMHTEPFPGGKRKFIIKNYDTGNHRVFVFDSERTLDLIDFDSEVKLTEWLFKSEDGIMCAILTQIIVDNGK